MESCASPEGSARLRRRYSCRKQTEIPKARRRAGRRKRRSVSQNVAFVACKSIVFQKKINFYFLICYAFLRYKRYKLQSLNKKRMLHKTRARNARPYGYAVAFSQHCRGAHRAPVIGICAKFRIYSFPVKMADFFQSFIIKFNERLEFYVRLM